MGALPHSRRYGTREPSNGYRLVGRPRLVRPLPTTPPLEELWVAEPYPGLRAVMKEALLLEGLPASVIAPAELRRELESGIRPRGLVIDALALEADPYLLEAMHDVDRLVVSSSTPVRLRGTTLLEEVCTDLRWLQKPFSLDELFDAIRWVAVALSEREAPPRMDPS